MTLSANPWDKGSALNFRADNVLKVFSNFDYRNWEYLQDRSYWEYFRSKTRLSSFPGIEAEHKEFIGLRECQLNYNKNIEASTGINQGFDPDCEKAQVEEYTAAVSLQAATVLYENAVFNKKLAVDKLRIELMKNNPFNREAELAAATEKFGKFEE